MSSAYVVAVLVLGVRFFPSSPPWVDGRYQVVVPYRNDSLVLNGDREQTNFWNVFNNLATLESLETMQSRRKRHITMQRRVRNHSHFFTRTITLITLDIS